MDKKKDNLPAESLEYLSDADAITHRPLPFFARITLYLLFGFVVFAIAWASFSQIDRIVTARGKIVSTATPVLIQPFVTSVVTSLEVVEGQVVKKGELLGRFDPTFVDADLSRLRGQFKEFQAHMGRLESELNNLTEIPGDDGSEEYLTHRRVLEERLAHNKAKLSHYSEAINRLSATQNANRQDQAILKLRLSSAQEIESMEQSMQSSGSSSKLRLLQAKDQRLALKNELQTAINKETILSHQISTAEAEMKAYERNRRKEMIEELSKVRAELRSVEEQIAKASRLANLSEMRAPSDAVVLKVAERSIGSVIREAEPLLTLVPLDASLEAKLEIDTKDVGYVRPGDLTRIKLDAFPFQKHGALEGKLRVVSEDAFTKDERNANTNVYYLAKASLGEKKLEKIPSDARLIPGMTLTAEIVVGQRSIISYFLYPVFRMLDESIREP